MLLFWNVRGLNNPLKQKRLRNILNQLRINLLCLLETHVTQDKQATMVDRLFPGCNVVDNYNHARLGRVWILFDDNVTLSIHGSS